MAIAVLVVLFGGLMAIVHAAYTDDRMGRAARAAARAVALETDTSASQAALVGIACEAIRQELDLEADFDCATAWTVTITTGLSADGACHRRQFRWRNRRHGSGRTRVGASCPGHAPRSFWGLRRGDGHRSRPSRTGNPGSRASGRRRTGCRGSDRRGIDSEESTEEQPSEPSASRDGASARWASRAAPLGSAPQALTEVA